MTSFTVKKIDVTFTTGSGSFAGGGNSKKLTGLRCVAKVDQPGGEASGYLTLAVYGMQMSDMMQLATLGIRINQVFNNGVQIDAGDDETGMSKVFTGTIQYSFFDGSSQPDVAFRVVAVAGGFAAVQPIEPSSYDGPTPVTTILGDLAKKGIPAFSFEPNGVNVVLSSPYLSGSLGNQINETIRHAGIYGGIVENNTLAVWPKQASRQGSTVPISPTTGMVGYPSYSNGTLIFRSLYNPAFKQGGQVQVSGSQIPAANGTFTISSLVHDLASQSPSGPWFTTVVSNLVAGSTADNYVEGQT